MGKALLIFPEQNGLDLVRLILRNSPPLSEMTEMEQEAFSEVGNIILNSCVGSIDVMDMYVQRPSREAPPPRLDSPLAARPAVSVYPFPLLGPRSFGVSQERVELALEQ